MLTRSINRSRNNNSCFRITSYYCARFLSTAKPTVSEFSQHQELFRELDLEEINLGVYNGKWSGQGPLVHSYNPATNKLIGSIRTVRL